MIWTKHGIVFTTEDKLSWAKHSALQPTPIVLENCIRVFVGMRDGIGVSRVGFVDFSKDDPSKVIGYSTCPCLEIGEPGCFDDNGVVPSAVLQHEGKLLLYYAGYQLVNRVRFLVLGGLAVSSDLGRTFSRYKRTPLFERTDSELLFRVPHSVIREGDVFRFWYGGGSSFVEHNGATFPTYDVRYTESKSPYLIPDVGRVVLSCHTDEYRLGRPYVIKEIDGYKMYFGNSTFESRYRLQVASSIDGLEWTRNPNGIGLNYGTDDFDSEMSAYPGVVRINSTLYIYYNGNDYGRHGIGLAEMSVSI
jgi:hypothetical protein